MVQASLLMEGESRRWNASKATKPMGRQEGPGQDSNQ